MKVWRNLGSEKCARAFEDVLSAICVMLLMWPLTVQPCDSLSKEFQTGPQAGVVFISEIVQHNFILNIMKRLR